MESSRKSYFVLRRRRRSRYSEEAEKVRYEKAPYHGENAQGVKSPEPKNAAQMLQKSFRFNKNSPQRVAYDSENDEFIVFSTGKNTTGNNEYVYHSHVRKWTDRIDKKTEKLKGLEDEMQNIFTDLYNAEKKNGKIR
ncbi:MAG: hypothetical protein EOO61_18650 [Hymenobacter sp.]|nr:MAG: hypothetical protein EOO61_18650 [Hymenobacter sp.]